MWEELQTFLLSEDIDHSSSGSDFEMDAIMNLSDGNDEPDIVISAEAAEGFDDEVHKCIEELQGKLQQSKVKQRRCQQSKIKCQQTRMAQLEISQLLNPPAGASGQGTQAPSQAQDADTCSESDSDPEYVPHSEDNGENLEAVELRRHAIKFKKKMRDTKSWIGRDAIDPVPLELIANMEEQLEADDKEWGYDSSDEVYSYDEDSHGHQVRSKSKFPRYNNDTKIPHFSFTMVFRSKSQLVKALKRYGLVSKRSIQFVKSKADRVRAKCGWDGYPWLIYGAKTSRTSRFQIITFNDEHHCAQNRENKLVTSKVIAQRYEHFILANPMWKIESMKATMLQDMFADVSTSKCKHAKKIVMDKLMAGMKEEYTRVFDYQLELLRSNPGSTVAVCLDPKIRDQHVFQSFYVCFNALKLGFKAGCRKVIGLDGCLFKGAVKGELSCAIARDANNQMYQVAWAVVEQETNESWKWFIGLLIKDLDINNNGAGWVFISDQQKGLINGMRDYLPNAEQRICARHTYANWRKKYMAHEWQKKFGLWQKHPTSKISIITRQSLHKKHLRAHRT
ncbi:unnamed protein product [Alopecurus aequalis]